MASKYSVSLKVLPVVQKLTLFEWRTYQGTWYYFQNFSNIVNATDACMGWEHGNQRRK